MTETSEETGIVEMASAGQTNDIQTTKPKTRLEDCKPWIKASGRPLRMTRTHVKDPVVHITVRWITETRKDPATDRKKDTCTCVQ